MKKEYSRCLIYCTEWRTNKPINFISFLLKYIDVIGIVVGIGSPGLLVYVNFKEIYFLINLLIYYGAYPMEDNNKFQKQMIVCAYFEMKSDGEL